MPKKMGLYGGAFDPIHRGHILLATGFVESLGLDKVLLMPAAVPPHKLRPHMASPEDRLAMCRLAAAPYPVLEVSDLELSRGGASFTADTLDELIQRYPDTEWYLLTGSDMFLTLSTWWRYEDIRQMAILCTAPRGAADRQAIEACAREMERDGAHCRICELDIPGDSSTAVRKGLEQGDSDTIEHMLSPAVYRYIREKQLYTTAEKGITMTSDQQFIEIIRGRETPKRFLHSLAVADEAERLARKYGADPAKARTAGILHDIAKNISNDEQLQMLQDFGIILTNLEENTPKLYHAITGAAFIEQILGVSDPDILQAVRYHTTGRAGMSLLEKVLYLADFTSADRTYDDVDILRRLVDEDLQAGLKYAVRYSVLEVLEKGGDVHPDTLMLYAEILNQGG